jgi:hypothetical protein
LSTDLSAVTGSAATHLQGVVLPSSIAHDEFIADGHFTFDAPGLFISLLERELADSGSRSWTGARSTDLLVVRGGESSGAGSAGVTD